MTATDQGIAPAEAADGKPDPLLYPEHVECPHCRGRKKVVFRYDLNKGWRAHVEEHDLVAGQATFNGRRGTNISYACPASLGGHPMTEDGAAIQRETH